MLTLESNLMNGLLFHDDAYQRTALAKVVSADENGIVLDQTIFYPLGGGQPGDTGMLIWDSKQCRLSETKKAGAHQIASAILHIPAEGQPTPPIGTDVELHLDWERRYNHMRVHTMMHILSSLVKGEVTGGQVRADSGRIDFNVPGDAIDKEVLNTELNSIIQNNYAVAERWITDEELQANPGLIKTMSVKPPMGMGRVRLLQIGDGIDLQPCGGTHVKHTGEIGPVEITKIENKGKQNRRVIAVLQNVPQAAA